PGFHGTLNNVDVSSDRSIDHINIDKSPRLHARVVSEVLAVVGGHRTAMPGAVKPTGNTGTAPAGQGGAPGAKPEAQPAAAPPPGTPAKSGNGADAGTATPVADGTQMIAAPERDVRKPAAGPQPVHSDQVRN